MVKKKSKKKRDRDWSQDIMSNIQAIHYKSEKQMDATFAPLEISNEQYKVLRILNESIEGSYSLKQIQALLPNKTTNTTRLVNKLHLKQLLIKTTAKNDKRLLQIKLNKAGAELLNKADIEISVINKKFKKALKDNNEKSFLKKLVEIKKALK